MKNTYRELIDQSYSFPQEGFELVDGYLSFYGVSIKALVDKYGTPFKLMYLPRIRQQISRARELFATAIKKYNYQGKYEYCYCTKCSHYAATVNTALKEGVHLETSSALDIDLIDSLYRSGELRRAITIIHNGYKTDAYLKKIVELQQMGFSNSIIVLDSTMELSRIKQLTQGQDLQLKLGIRMAIDEQPQSSYYSSRLGIRHTEILDFYRDHIHGDDQLSLEMLHFYVDSGIKDDMYYWREFRKAMDIYVALKSECSSLQKLNLGGGFPIRNNLRFDYDYAYIIEELVKNIKAICTTESIEEPDIYTEFGKYTVGESGAIIFSVLEQKQQNDQEKWYLVDNSLMNTIPDAWSNCEKFILLPINKWDHEYERVNIGGISCDHSDYYNSEDLNQEIILPKYPDAEQETLYLGFFHTGAYQDAISGYGGIKHCLLPSPRRVVIDTDTEGKHIDTLYDDNQSVEQMLKTLGYQRDNKIQRR